MADPRPHQILFCHSILQDEEGRSALIGLFAGARASKFPTIIPNAVFFASFSDFPGDAEVAMTIVDPNGDELSRVPLALGDASPGAGGHQIYVRINGLELPSPGMYVVRFDDRGKTIAERVFMVERVGAE